MIGIILSGYLNDGASGLWTIKQQGGMILIQNPDDAEHKELPINVMEHINPDYIFNASDMGLIISEFIKKPAPEILKLTQEEEYIYRLWKKVAKNSFL